MRADPSIVVAQNFGESAEFGVVGWREGGGFGLRLVLALGKAKAPVVAPDREGGWLRLGVGREMEWGRWAGRLTLGRAMPEGTPLPIGEMGCPLEDRP